MEEVDVEDFSDKNRPGVSGKKKGKKSWLNLSDLKKQHGFLQSRARSGASDKNLPGFETVGRGSNLHGRSGLEDQQETSFLKNGENASEEKLHESIKIALQRSPETDLSNVIINVAEAEVTLSGTMTEAKEKYAIEAVVRNIPGVKKVHNLLQIPSEK